MLQRMLDFLQGELPGIVIRISLSILAAQSFASPFVSKVLATGVKLLIRTVAVNVVLLFPFRV
jgi:hypothetical protein